MKYRVLNEVDRHRDDDPIFPISAMPVDSLQDAIAALCATPVPHHDGCFALLIKKDTMAFAYVRDNERIEATPAYVWKSGGRSGYDNAIARVIRRAHGQL